MGDQAIAIIIGVLIAAAATLFVINVRAAKEAEEPDVRLDYLTLGLLGGVILFAMDGAFFRPPPESGLYLIVVGLSALNAAYYSKWRQLF